MNKIQKKLISGLKKWITYWKRNPSLKDFGKNNLESRYRYCKNFGKLSTAIKIANCKTDAEVKSIILNFQESNKVYNLIDDIKLAEDLNDQNILKRKLINLKKYIETESYTMITAQQWRQVENVINKYENIFV